jgi:hypothetical protein
VRGGVGHCQLGVPTLEASVGALRSPTCCWMSTEIESAAGLPGPVKLIASFGFRVRFGRKRNDCLCHSCTAAQLSSTPLSKTLRRNFHHPIGPDTIRSPVDNSFSSPVWLVSQAAEPASCLPAFVRCVVRAVPQQIRYFGSATVPKKSEGPTAVRASVFLRLPQHSQTR